MRASFTSYGGLVLLLLAGCGGGGAVDSRDAPTAPADATPENPIGQQAAFTPNRFLKFLDAQDALGAGRHEVVVGTATPGTTGSFSVRILLDDGSEAVRDGAWDAASDGGRDDPAHGGNPRFVVDLPRSGGLLVEVDAASDAVLFLVRGDRVLARRNAAGPGEPETLRLPGAAIDSPEFAQAYYATVDPLGLRDTLEGWKAENGFGSGPGGVVNALFRDAKDLGYGRDMYAWRRPGGDPARGCGIAVFEDNYVVQLEEGDASTYGPLNLDAAIERDRRYLVGSNAIEFGPLSGGSCTDPSTWVVSFFTFAPPDSGLPGCAAGAQCRRDAVDFDGRGVKAMPGVCVVCHGGTLRPPAPGADSFLDAPGDFASASRHVSIKSSSFSVLNPESLEFSDREGFTFAAQQPNVSAVAGLVREVFLAQASRSDTTDDVENWSADFALDWLAGLGVGDPADASPDLLTATSDYLPEGWGEAAVEAVAPGRADEAARLYEQVVEPYCLGCHALRGSVVAERNEANAVNFASYERFLAYRDETIDLVYRSGEMPSSIISFARFWEDPVAPQLLADALDFSAAVEVPGRPVARPGADRLLFFPVLPEGGTLARTIELDGTASDYSSGFSWRVVESPGGEALEDAGAPIARLRVTQQGTYRLGLVTSNERFGEGAERFVAIRFSTELLDDRETVFVEGGDLQRSVTVEQLFDDGGTDACTVCHNAAADERYLGIPLYLDPVSHGDGASFYRAVRARVNLAAPERSPLLTKPLAERPVHGGGRVLREAPCDVVDPDEACLLDPELETERYLRYQRLLAWIRAGAPCGGDPDYCGYARVETAPPLQPTATSAESGGFLLSGTEQVELRWRDNAVNETGFLVQRSTEAAFADPSAIVEFQAGPSGTLEGGVTDEGGDDGLLSATTYHYRVAALNSFGRSPAFSEPASVTTRAPPDGPILETPAVWSDVELRLQWSAVDGVSGYRVERREGDTPFQTLATVGSAQTRFEATGLAPARRYVFRVVALDADTPLTTASNEAEASTVASGLTLWNASSGGCRSSSCHGDGSNATAPIVPVLQFGTDARSAPAILEAIVTGPSFMPSTLLADDREAKVRAICRVLAGGSQCDAEL